MRIWNLCAIGFLCTFGLFVQLDFRRIWILLEFMCNWILCAFGLYAQLDFMRICIFMRIWILCTIGF
jgi:hypothetical protein